MLYLIIQPEIQKPMEPKSIFDKLIATVATVDRPVIAVAIPIMKPPIAVNNHIITTSRIQLSILSSLS